MKKQNGFVLVETLIVVLLLTVTLMSLYSTFSNIMIKTRSKSNNDTIDTIYKTYFVKDLLDNLYYNADTNENYVDSFAYYASKFNRSGCKGFSYTNVTSTVDMTSAGNVIEVCDFSSYLNNTSYNSDPLYDVVNTYNIQKIYYVNFNKLGNINEDNLKVLYNSSYFDASSIDYLKSQGKDLDGNFIIIKYLKDYLNPLDKVTYKNEAGETVTTELVNYKDDSFKITKDAYHSKISLTEVTRKENVLPLAFYSDAGKSEHYYVDGIPDDTEYVLPYNMGWSGHSGDVVVGWVTNTDLLKEGEYDRCMSGSPTAEGKCYKANTPVIINSENRELYAIWCGDGTLKGAMECQTASYNGTDGLTRTDKDGNYDNDGNFVYKGTGLNQNFAVVGDYCFNLISNFGSGDGIKAIYYGKYIAADNKCGERKAYSSSAYNTDRFYGSASYMYKDQYHLDYLGNADELALIIGIEEKVVIDISPDSEIPYNEYVYYGDKVVYDGSKYTLKKSNGSDVTEKVLFYASKQASYEDLNQFKGKYFCKGGQTTTCESVLYLSNIHQGNSQLSLFKFKDGIYRELVGSQQLALSSSITYSNGKYHLNTNDMYYVSIYNFTVAKNNTSSDTHKNINTHRYACAHWLKDKDGSNYECDYVYEILSYKGYATYRNGMLTYNDAYEYVHGPSNQTVFGKDKDSRKNESTAKTVLDKFFTDSFVGKSANGVELTDLIDYSATFCNNLDIYTGFGKSRHTLTEAWTVKYNSYTDDWNTANRAKDYYTKCPQKYNYSIDTSNGNGLLTYPVGLITMNEAYYVGLFNPYKTDATYPTSHYLNNVGLTFTSVGGLFNTDAKMYTDVITVLHDGHVYSWPGTALTASYGMNPVISIKLSNHIVSGTGSKDDPFVFGGA